MARSRLYPPSVDPGFPALPPRPDGWVRTTFRELVEPVERPVTLVPDRTYKLVNAKRGRGGIVLRGEATGRDILTKTQFEVKAGDFVISRRQIIHGACGVVPADLDGAIVSNEYSVLRPKPALLLQFLEHYSHTAYFQRTCFHSSHGVDVEKMVFKLDRWLSWPVDVPPLAVQRTVAAILDAVDENIDATKAVIDSVTKTRKQLAESLLSRGLPGAHREFAPSKIGAVPAGWHVHSLRERMREPIRNGYSPVCPTTDTGRWTLSLSAVSEEGFRAEGAKPAPTDDARLNEVLLESGDLLISRSNTRERVGLVGVYRNDPQPCSYPDLLMRLRPDAGLLPEFLAAVLLQERARSYFSTSARGTSGSMVKINREIVGNYLVPVPPMAEQVRIVGVLEAFRERLRAEEAVLFRLHDLRAALVSDLLMGRTRAPSGRAA